MAEIPVLLSIVLLAQIAIYVDRYISMRKAYRRLTGA